MDPATLLEHRDFVKSVAGALLRNDADIEDAVQETYVAALQADPPRTGRVRPWLGGITRNVAKRLQRSRTRRTRRERAVARPDRAAEQCTEKLRWQQRVVEEVLALDPIYRDVLLLRFYEELPPRAIAAKLDVPVNTVRSRFRRGLEQLRKRFDERWGRKSWSFGLAALFTTKSAAAGTGKLVAAALVAVVAGTAWIGHRVWRDDGARRSERTARATADEPVSPSAKADSKPGAGAKNDAPPPPEHFRGRILDFRRKPHPPIAGATVYLSRGTGAHRAGWDPVAQAQTDADGRFVIPWDPAWDPRSTKEGQLQAFLLYVEHDRHWTDPMYLYSQGFREGYDLPVQLLAHPRMRFVRDGQPVAGVHVSLAPPLDIERLHEDPPFLHATTDADGGVELAWPTYHAGAHMTAVLPGGDRIRWPIAMTDVLSYDPYVVDVDPEEIATVSILVTGRDGKAPPRGTRVAVSGHWAPDADRGAEDGLALNRHGVRRPLLADVDAGGRAVFRFPADRARHGAYVPGFMCAFAPGPRYTARYIQHDRLWDSIAFTGQSLPTLALGTFDDGQPRILLAWPVPHLDAPASLFGARARYVLYRRAPGGSVAIEELDFAYGMPGARVLGARDQAMDPPAADERIVIAAESRERFVWCEMSGAELTTCLQDQVPVRLDRHTAMRTLDVDPRASGEFELTASALPFRVSMPVTEGYAFKIQIPDVDGSWQVRFGDQASSFDPADGAELVLE